MSITPNWLREFEVNGYRVVPEVIDRARVRTLVDALDGVGDEPGVRARRNATYAVRNLLSLAPEVRELAASAEIRALVEPVLGVGSRAVRGLLFDKSPAANWKVAWHQDLSITVKTRAEADGFGPWSKKAGVVHVQPPVKVLEAMVTVRVHLDDCFEDNGPLQVLPGSHRFGVVDADRAGRLREKSSAVSCTVGAGGVVLIRPLVLHASAVASTPTHRRVVHLEFASPGALPAGIEWHEFDESEVT